MHVSYNEWSLVLRSYDGATERNQMTQAFVLTPVHIGTAPEFAHRPPQTNNWTFRNGSHGTLANRANQFHFPGSNLSLQG